jgi:alpha-galactosidase
MTITKNRAENVKIAYIGGGSRGWAWGLMSDLATATDMSGEVFLYDIDYEAAKTNEIIGNKIKESKDAWKYTAVPTLGEALTGANFVIISILPGTFDEMESDVHTPEEYGIYQAVGDTVGPGGIVRAMRTVPMFEEIAHAVEQYCPDAWVINYTNPMTVCVKALYSAFPKIANCLSDYRARDMLNGHIVQVLNLDGEVVQETRAVGIGDNFELLTCDENGNRSSIASGEVSVRL